MNSHSPITHAPHSSPYMCDLFWSSDDKGGGGNEDMQTLLDIS